MAHLKVYLKGTPGAADGEEWTDDTTIKGIMTNTQASSRGHGCAFLPISCFFDRKMSPCAQLETS